jgi:hypothetical protein
MADTFRRQNVGTERDHLRYLLHYCGAKPRAPGARRITRAGTFRLSPPVVLV